MAKAKSKGPLINAAQDQLEKQIWRLAMRQYRHIKLPFTFEDLMQLFIAPEWRKRLFEVYQYAAPGGVSYDYNAGVIDQRVGNGTRLLPVTVKFSWRSGQDGGFLPPRSEGNSMHPMLTVQDDCPGELREKWEHMMHELCGVAHDFGEVRWLLQKLNHKDVCPSAACIRYFWPPLVPLLELAGLHELASSVREASAKSAWYAKIPADLHERLKDTSDFMARALLVDDPDGPTSLPVSYQMNEVNFGRYMGMLDHL
jgi:hypothetical protein